MEIEPILDKPPPSAEGELLKQNSKTVLGLMQWRNCYLAVRNDKLLYFKNKEDCEMNKEPIAAFRMSQIEEIVEAVFNGVPKKHHVNCGFSVVIYQSSTGKRENFNLLAETPESMRLWVYNLRYIKAYWSRKHTRETVINEEQERRLLEKLLREEEDNKEALVGEYSISTEGGEAQEPSAKQHPMTLYFDSGTKLPMKVSLTDTVAGVLEKVSDRLSSSGDLMWTVDTQGQESVLSPTDTLALLALKGHRFYVLNPAKRILVTFFNKKSDTSFECIAVPTSITASDVLQHHDVAAKVDLLGIANPGLFLKSREESLFDSNECPCDALFAVIDGKIERQSTDYLVVKNKAIGGSQFTSRPKRPTQRTTRYFHSKVEAEVEEEDAQANALNRLYQNTSKSGSTDTGTEKPKQLSPKMQRVPRPDPKGSEDATFPGIPRSRQRDVASPTPPQATPPQATPPQATRSGTGSVKDTSSSSSRTAATSSQSSSQTSGPPADNQSFEDAQSRFQRRGAQRSTGGSSRRIGLKNELITETNEEDPATQRERTVIAPVPSPKTTASQAEKTQPERSVPAQTEKAVPTQAEKSTTPLDKATATQPQKSVATQKTMATQPEKTEKTMATQPEKTEKTMATQPDKTMETQPEKSVQSERRRKVVTSYEESKETAPALTTPTSASDPPPPPSEPFRPAPMVINLEKLASLNKAPPTDSAPSLLAGKPVAPIDIRTPNMLKMVLLQASESSSVVSETSGPMDLISLSGVGLRNERGTWRMVAGSSFHDAPPTTSTDHTESFPLAGGIRAVFNHTQKCWYVLPPLMVATGESLQEHKALTESQKSGSVERSDSYSKPTELFLSKKALVTGVGGAIHSVLAQFEQTRSVEEKKRIGCDMTNPNMGHLVRGALCTAMARVLLDGLKPYRFQGLVTDDIWKVTSAFWQEAVTKGHLLPAVDKQVFQPIRCLDGSYDNNMKYRTFVCSAMNKGALSTWIETLPNQKDTLNRHFQPTAFLMLVSENEEFGRLFNELLVILEPLMHIPFSFSLDFELRQSAMWNTEVPAKTNASTGQVVLPPGPIEPQGDALKAPPPTQEASPGTSSEGQVPSQKDAAGGRAQTTASIQKSLDGLLGSWSTSTSGWFKKVSSGLQQFDLNAGGALFTKTSAPASAKPPPSEPAPPPPPPAAPPSSVQVPLRRMEAVYNNVAEEADELPFQKGDILILNEQINAEWYICTKGDRTGMVPANYVRLIDPTK